MKTKDTESEILKAAEQEFMLKGFDGAKTTSIAHAAGVTHAMLHYYFRASRCWLLSVNRDCLSWSG